MSTYTEIREGYLVEPESCAHEIARNWRCPDCGMSGAERKRERSLRERGFTVSEIAELDLLKADWA